MIPLGEFTEAALEVRRGQVTREFESLGAFALHLVAANAAWRLERKHALNAVATLIKKDCRAQIGHYQEAIGEYPAWADLAESTEDEKARLGAPPDAPLERFGDLKKSFRSELIGDDEVIIGSTDFVMTYHEFGTSRMSPRPVLGPAYVKNIEPIREILGVAIIDAVLVGQHLGYRLGSEESPDE